MLCGSASCGVAGHFGPVGDRAERGRREGGKELAFLARSVILLSGMPHPRPRREPCRGPRGSPTPTPSTTSPCFVGSPRFVARLEKRFGLTRPDALVRREPAGTAVVLVGPRLGKRPPRPK